MTVRINLLPHREQKRVARQRQFVLLAALTFGLGAVIAVAGHTFIASRISGQEGRNAFLKTEISKLDKEIEEIKVLKEKTTALLERKKIVEALQSNRSQVVHLLDQLVRQLPSGVYLKSIEQKGNEVKLVGYAQSNARVASLMRNLDASEWLDGAVLIETKAVILNNLRVSEFSMSIKLSQPKSADEADKKISLPANDKDKKA
ncbi:MAG: PilN domain-containing protein [Sulfuricella denitrificans]|nr:PilN domain-containing protein [Sulfuricella denitrificans]